MENLVNPSPAFWRGKRVLVTGHTGFKGSWLAMWLARLGAEVEGYALDSPTVPSCFVSARVGEHIAASHTGDIRDLQALTAQFRRQQPEIVFHLAAQPLVRRSYADPVGTYQTNIMGTVHVLEAARQAGSVRVLVNITSDKCYENRETPGGYRETDPMGGYDPYSSSKGCAELVSAAYRRSFLEQAGVRMATARAGNVIGGGDWAEDRLIPDCVRALLKGETIVIRRPQSVRPWQHVLEPLAGYLLLAERLWADSGTGHAYNFGPGEEDAEPVARVVETLIELWGGGNWVVDSAATVHEAGLLMLDSTLARTQLRWAPRLRLRDALEMAIEWYRAAGGGAAMDSFTLAQIGAYEARATSAPWSCEYSVEADVSPAFAWSWWTDVGNWADPPARFSLEGLFAPGSRGITWVPGQEPLEWAIGDVDPGRSARIHMPLDRAAMCFEWRFEALSDGRTRLTQRIELSGENTAAYAQAGAAFAANLADGMKKLTAAMARAEAAGSAG